jgi:hypothetical protein
MDDLTLLALGGAAVIGLAAALILMKRDEQVEAAADVEGAYAVSTEGMKRCASCGLGNLVSDATCASCGSRLPG